MPSAKKKLRKSPKPKKSKSRKSASKKAKSPAKRGCTRQTTSKYTSRPSPPYPANECCGQTFQGNDGEMYESRMAKNGICKWIRVE